MIKYAPFEGRGWQPYPEFLSKKEAVINIRTSDQRCFGYALLYFHEREQLPERHCERATLYTNQMFQRHHLDILYYPILPNDAHLYEDQLQINIDVFSYFDDEGRVRHPLVISRKNYEREANHFIGRSITHQSQAFPVCSKITKHKEQQYLPPLPRTFSYKRKLHAPQGAVHP